MGTTKLIVQRWSVTLEFDQAKNRLGDVLRAADRHCPDSMTVRGSWQAHPETGRIVFEPGSEAAAHALFKKLSPFAHGLAGNYLLSCALEQVRGQRKVSRTEGRREKARRAA